YFDGKYKLIQLFRYYTAQYLSNILKFWRERFNTRNKLIETTILISIAVFALCIRMKDSIAHVAPSFLDSYTTLKWIKELRVNHLFSDGIIPQGFQLFWAAIQEFGRMDT